MNNMLAFLSQVTVEAVVVPVKAASAPRVARVYQPADNEADLRIWDNGAIYPSNALIAEYNLEYAPKDAQDSGYGLDIIDTQAMPSIKTPQRFIGVSITARKEGKIDVFRATTYKEDGSPSTSVTTQGTAMFGKETLLPLLREVYNVIPNETGYIDLKIVREFPITSPNGIFQFPKTVSRGDNKGQISFTRRENQTIFPLFADEKSRFLTAEELEAERIEAEKANAVEVPEMVIPGSITASIAEHPATPAESFKTGTEVAAELQAQAQEEQAQAVTEIPEVASDVTEEKEYDTMMVGKIAVEVEKETNPLFLKLKEEQAGNAAIAPAGDPFAEANTAPATEEEEEEFETTPEVVSGDAFDIQAKIENGEYDAEAEAEDAEEIYDEAGLSEVIEEDEVAIDVDPFADVPFTRPVAVAK